VRRMAAIKDGEKVVGNRTKVKIVKNKVAAPFREAEVDILYGVGISREGDLLDLGVTQELVEKSGSWYSFGGERIGQGRETARAFLVDNPAVADRLDADLRRQLELAPVSSPLPVAAGQLEMAQLDRMKTARSA
jgi:recombination protein RecA